MLNKNIIFSRHPKDDFSSTLLKAGLLKRKKNYIESFSKKLNLRNRSVQNKHKSNTNFDLSNILMCRRSCKKNCLMETDKKRKIVSSIEGLNCDQIDENLFASSRLTNRVIKEKDLISKFKKLNIGLIVNCQEKGEHPICGSPFNDGLDPCGFAYSTNELENNGIHVLKCGWKDFGPPSSFSHIIKVVKTMYYYIHTLNKKILVHCHAGYGRTAIAVCCYLIYEKNVSPEEARQEFRKGPRKNCLSGGVQFEYCKEFYEYLKICRENFETGGKKNVAIFKTNENIFNVGNYKFLYFDDNNFINNVPIFLLYIFDRIIQIKKEKNIDQKIINDYLIKKEINESQEIIIQNLKSEINNYKLDIINKVEDIVILGKLLFIWLNDSIIYVINSNELLSINDKSYPLTFENIKDATKNLINSIVKFILLIIDNKIENIDKIKEFLEIFIPSLIGKYDNSEIKKKSIEKIRTLILRSLNKSG